ncbi:putative molybdopterin cofactor sulfurase, partial [Corchorus capsularis]
EEEGTSKELSSLSSSAMNGARLNNGLANGSTSSISSEIKESAIRRESEGEFRLLGRREGSRYNGGRFIGVEDEHPSRGRKVSFSMEDVRKERLSHTL